MLDIIKNGILIVVAHHDDETLFCGGLLIELSKKKIDIYLIVISDIKEENTNYESKFKYNNFKNILKLFNIKYKELNIKNNLEIENIDDYKSKIKDFNLLDFKSENKLYKIDKNKYDVILTHNIEGEYGHKQHIFTHHLIKKYMDNKLIYTFGNKDSKIKIKINKEEKLNLIKIYTFKDTKIKKNIWFKQCMKNYTFWCDNEYEYYDKLLIK